MRGREDQRRSLLLKHTSLCLSQSLTPFVSCPPSLFHLSSYQICRTLICFCSARWQMWRISRVQCIRKYCIYPAALSTEYTHSHTLYIDTESFMNALITCLEFWCRPLSTDSLRCSSYPSGGNKKGQSTDHYSSSRALWVGDHSLSFILFLLPTHHLCETWVEQWSSRAVGYWLKKRSLLHHCCT